MDARIAFAAVALAWSGAGQATITLYDSQAAFLSAAGTTGTDSFDDLIEELLVPGPVDRVAGAYAYKASAGPTSTSLAPATDDGLDLFLSTNARFDTVTFSAFASGVKAAGASFFATDQFGTSIAADAITVRVTDGADSITQVTLNPTKASFLGFVSDRTLVSLEVFVGDKPGVWPTVNDLVLGAGPAFPEPSRWAMMIMGFCAAGAVARRRRVAPRFA